MSQPVFESVDSFAPDEFARWVVEREQHGDVNHYELLNGRIVMTPPAGWPHGSVEAALVTALGAYVRAKGLGRVLGSSQGYELPSDDTVEPDVSYVSNERWSAAPAPEEGKFLRVVPDLVMEILSRSTSTYDRGEKRAIYERNGVREYWLVDPIAQRIVVLSLEGDRYRQIAVQELDGRVASGLLPGFEIALGEVFAT